MIFKSKKKGVKQFYNGKIIAVFRDYTFETEDMNKAKILDKLGYEHNGKIEESKKQEVKEPETKKQEPKLENLKRNELFELCRRYEIDNYSRMKNTEIVDALKEVIG